LSAFIASVTLQNGFQVLF